MPSKLRFRKETAFSGPASLHACGYGIYRWRNVPARRYEYAVVAEGGSDRTPASFATVAEAKENVTERCSRQGGA